MSAPITFPKRWAAHIAQLMPSLDDYSGLRSSWRADLIAGVTVAIVALPLALGFGVASGVGPAAGLVTAVVAGIVAAVFGGSRIQVSGPTSAMAVVLAPIVAQRGAASVALVAGMAGIVLIVAGYLKLGRIVGIIPWPVIEGFTVGIAVIIGAQQIPRAFDVAPPTGANTVVSAIRAMIHPGPEFAWTLGAVAIVAVIMVGSRRISKRIPDSLLAVVAVTILAEVLHAPLTRIGKLPDSLPAPSLPHLGDLAHVESLMAPALAVAALAAIESLLSAKVASQMAPVGDLQPDRELLGQGMASLASGAFGGMPATGAIARTAVNVSSGGRSRVAAITHGLVLLGVVYGISSVVSTIPLAALSGVLLVVAVRMVDVETVSALLHSTRVAAALFTMTGVVTIAFDLIDAVLIGIAAAAFFTLRQLANMGGVRRDPLPDDPQPGDEHIALVTINGALFFAASERIASDVREFDSADVVILRLSQLTMLDASGAKALSELVLTLQRRGVRVVLKGLREQDRELLNRMGALDAETPVFAELPDAVAEARRIRREVASLPPQFRRH